MGVAFSHGSAAISYTGFNEARIKLAQSIGVVNRRSKKDWSDIKDDIVPLLNHSDCDGDLTPEECRKVAPRLLEIISQWPDDWDKCFFIELAEGMRLAAEANEPLEFT